MKTCGVIAAGHAETANAAEIILREGGNAFDAIVAAHYAACIAEPVLASLGGGGFLLAHTAGGKTGVFDFFVHTPRYKAADAALDFHPILANFGTAQQEFHIGAASIATPGTVRGLFDIHRELCTMPMSSLVEPALHLAKNGVRLNHFQAYIFSIVGEIFSLTADARTIYHSKEHHGKILAENEILHQPQLADFLEVLAHEGDELFYRGEVAQAIAKLCHDRNGHLGIDDLARYQVVRRKPLAFDYRNTRVFTNPPPSSGGILIALALALLRDTDLHSFGHGSYQHLDLLAHVMAQTNKARIDAQLASTEASPLALLDPVFLQAYRDQVYRRAQSLRGTTHINVMDKHGNIASLSVSNGEGCGHLIPGTGIMLNNMLGEEDLNPGGFHHWETNQRMTSMMSPTLLITGDNKRIAIGSGGSNRIRTAILQVMSNLLDFDMPLEDAVNQPRIHFENQLLNIEEGFPLHTIERLCAEFSEHKLWPDRNLFFGGTHSTMHDGDRYSGAGDPRRGGVTITVA